MLANVHILLWSEIIFFFKSFPVLAIICKKLNCQKGGNNMEKKKKKKNMKKLISKKFLSMSD
jgi:hypothetical protein